GTNGQSTTASISVTVANATPTSTSTTAAPQVDVTTPSNGQTLSGSLPFEATPSGATVAKVTFAVDGQTKRTETGAPYMYNGDPTGRLDTTTLSNGTHTLSASAYGTNGQSSTESISINVSNTGAAPSAAPSAQPSTSSPWKGWSIPSVPAGAI